MHILDAWTKANVFGFEQKQLGDTGEKPRHLPVMGERNARCISGICPLVAAVTERRGERPWEDRDEHVSYWDFGDFWEGWKERKIARKEGSDEQYIMWETVKRAECFPHVTHSLMLSSSKIIGCRNTIWNQPSNSFSSSSLGENPFALGNGQLPYSNSEFPCKLLQGETVVGRKLCLGDLRLKFLYKILPSNFKSKSFGFTVRWNSFKTNLSI